MIGRITVDPIARDRQRYDTEGDWHFTQKGDLAVFITDQPDWKVYACLAVHEIVEALLCRAQGVTCEQVDEWDMGHPEMEEPGDDPRAPYMHQHRIAMVIERLLAYEMGVDMAGPLYRVNGHRA